jgi:AcrR family transcriptional regulator
MPSAKPQSGKAESAKAAQTRDAIVGVCLRLFAERGFASTSVDEIARTAGITKGAIYWHFANKDALFTGILTLIRGVWTHRGTGDFRQDVDAPALARLIVSSLTGAHIQAKYSKGVRMHLLLGELREAVLLHATVRRLGSA